MASLHKIWASAYYFVKQHPLSRFSTMVHIQEIHEEIKEQAQPPIVHTVEPGLPIHFGDENDSDTAETKPSANNEWRPGRLVPPRVWSNPKDEWEFANEEMEADHSVHSESSEVPEDRDIPSPEEIATPNAESATGMEIPNDLLQQFFDNRDSSRASGKGNKGKSKNKNKTENRPIGSNPIGWRQTNSWSKPASGQDWSQTKQDWSQSKQDSAQSKHDWSQSEWKSNSQSSGSNKVQPYQSQARSSKETYESGNKAWSKSESRSDYSDRKSNQDWKQTDWKQPNWSASEPPAGSKYTPNKRLNAESSQRRSTDEIGATVKVAIRKAKNMAITNLPPMMRRPRTSAPNLKGRQAAPEEQKAHYQENHNVE